MVYNGIDLDKFRPPRSIIEKEKIKDKFHLQSDKKYLICVAAPVALKGWILLFNALSEIKDEISNWELLCVAVNRTTSDALNLKQEAELKGISDLVTVIGQVSHDDLADLYRASEAFVLPSYNEGMANALLEAAATDLKIIATDVGGHSEIFANAPELSLIKPGNLNELKAALLKLFSETSGISVGTREMVLKVGSYQDNARKILEKFNKKNN